MCDVIDQLAITKHQQIELLCRFDTILIFEWNKNMRYRHTHTRTAMQLYPIQVYK